MDDFPALDGYAAAAACFESLLLRSATTISYSKEESTLSEGSSQSVNARVLVMVLIYLV